MELKRTTKQIRLKSELHRDLKLQAAENGVTMSALLEAILHKHLIEVGLGFKSIQTRS